MATHRPPADIDDFKSTITSTPQALRDAWSATVDDLMRSYDQGLFFNSTTDTSPGTPAEPPGITWNAFPLALEKIFSAFPSPQARAAALKYAETRRPLPVKREDTGAQVSGFVQRRQDEYCEWFIYLVNNRVTRISFTCENPEYWEFLFSKDPALVVSLYNDILGRTDVVESDLAWPWDVTVGDAVGQYKKSTYNRYNKWNTLLGAVHLTHSANTLGAEIDLAAKATRRWPVTLGQNDDAQRLTCCSGWGNPNRSSDPSIGKGVFDIAATGIAVTLAEPVGLYMLKPNLSGRLRAPDGTDIGVSALQVRRGSPDGTKVLRMEITPPPGSTYGLNDCTLDGVKLEYGGQIARLITMAVFGVGKQIPGRVPVVPTQCENFCCSHPNAPDFVVPFDNVPGHPLCQNIPQDEFPPIPPVPTIDADNVLMLHNAMGPRALEFRAKIRRNKASRLAY